MTTTARQLDELLQRDAREGELRPYVERSPADALTVYFKPDRDYSRRLSDHVTLLLSLEDDQLIGWRLHGQRNN